MGLNPLLRPSDGHKSSRNSSIPPNHEPSLVDALSEECESLVCSSFPIVSEEVNSHRSFRSFVPTDSIYQCAYIVFLAVSCFSLLNTWFEGV